MIDNYNYVLQYLQHFAFHQTGQAHSRNITNYQCEIHKFPDYECFVGWQFVETWANIITSIAYLGIGIPAMQF